MTLEYLSYLVIVIFCSICLFVRYSYKKNKKYLLGVRFSIKTATMQL